MSRTRSEPKGVVASEAWRLMLDFSMAQFGRTSGILQQLGLTPGHMKALMLLEPGQARPMGSLAEAFACDASTVTWLVDRLEERGLVERRMQSADRRVKAVALTPRGVKTKAELQRRLHEPPSELLAMDRAIVESLRDALTALARAARPVPTGRSESAG